MIRRREHRAPDGLQMSLFLSPVSDAGPASKGTPIFKRDDPTTIGVGAQRLDDYLRAIERGWVLQLRELICELNYDAFVCKYVGTGRRPFHPRAMLGLLVYGALRGCSSLRELEDLARDDVSAWWVTGGGQPDHSVLGRFVQRHQETLTNDAFVQATQHCMERLLIKAPGTCGIDGTTVEAASSHYRSMTAPKLADKVTAATAAAAAAPDDDKLKKQAETLTTALNVAVERTAARQKKHGRKGQVPVIPNEIDAVVQGLKNGDLARPAYKAVLMTHESGVIVGQTVQPSCESKALPCLLEQHQAIFGAEPKRALLDAGFFSLKTLAMFVQRDIDILCPPGRAVDDVSYERALKPGARFPKAAFVADGETLRCPAGRLMIVGSEGDDEFGPFTRYVGNDCRSCPLLNKCTTMKFVREGTGVMTRMVRANRVVERYRDDDLKDTMRAVFKDPRAREAYRQRGRISETPNATLKRRGMTRFRRRGLIGARAELAIHALALTLGRTAKLLVVMARFLLVDGAGRVLAHACSVHAVLVPTA